MNWVVLSTLLLCAPCVLAMEKKNANNPRAGHYNFHKKPQYFYRSVKPGSQSFQAMESKGASANNKPLTSLIHDKKNHLIIAMATLPLNGHRDTTVTVKKRTDVDWTNVYCVEHSITKKSDYFGSFLLESYLKDKIKMFEDSLSKGE